MNRILPCGLDVLSFLVMTLFLCELSLGQEKVIKEILISGNVRTKDYIIMRELTSAVDSCYSGEKIKRDRDRLLNLGIFSYIELDTLERGDSVKIVIYVQERLRFAPFPLLGYTEMDRWAYGGGFYFRNIQGRNRAVRCYTLFGGTMQFSAAFYDPWIMGERVSLTAEAEQIVRDHPYELFRQQDQTLWAEIGKTWNYTLSARVKIGYRKVTSDITGITLSGDYYDYLPFIRLTGIYDTRDVWVNPIKGWAGGVKIGQDGIPGDKPDFYELDLSLVRFFPVPIGRTIGIMGACGVRNGSIPVYERFYFGGMSSVRGLPPNYSQGSRMILTGLEYRFDIIKPSLIWRNFDAGCGGVIFFDCGAAGYNSSDLMRGRYYSGFGAGLRFFVPFIEVARFDCGWTADSTCRWGAEVGMKF